MVPDLRISNGALPLPVANTDFSSKLSSAASSSKSRSDSQFGDLFRETVEGVGNLEQNARVAIQGLMNGSGVDVHQALIASEKATEAFELALAMRNKAVQCYQAVMSMQF